MAFTSREAIFVALWNLLKATTPPSGAWGLQSRNLKPWEQVDQADQPALFMVETAQDGSMPDMALEQWHLRATVWVYYRADENQDSTVARDTAANNFIDVFDQAINPQPGALQQLGGLVYHTYIDGKIVFDSGLTDSQAVILIPVTMVVGAFGA